ncbi:MAG: hypothetical protein R2880_17580 [Deinococcales bacterium]
MSIALLNVFQQNLTNGMGFIAVALVYFGGWRPLFVLLGSLIFSFVNAIQLWLQVLGRAHSLRYCGDAALSLNHYRFGAFSPKGKSTCGAE